MAKLHIAYDPVYAHPLPEGHRFPMAKYELIPGQLLYEGTINEANLFVPRPCRDEVVLLTHDSAYVDQLKSGSLGLKEQRRIGFPQSPELIQREWLITGGTVECCHHALLNGVAMNVAGGTHHAFRSKGEGFCLLNDFAVAANYLLKENMASKILILDLDVHQGNGTASIFRNDPRVFTCSFHGRNNYPFQKEQSDRDVELEDGTDTETYLRLLTACLPGLLREVQPDFVFYLSGVDILETDNFGKLKVTLQGCRERDAAVFHAMRNNKIPCVVAMGGGYSAQVNIIVEAHCNTFRQAKELYGLD